MKTSKKKIIAIIPARSGSESIKNKNILLYKKRPLLYHSINTALKIKFIDRVIVSTDSKKYAKLSKKFGAEVPFLRPKSISQSKSLDIDFIKHCYNFLKKERYYPDIIVLLRPTTPNRKEKIINRGIKFFLKNFKNYDSMRSVSIFNQPPQKMFQIKKKLLVGFFDKYLKGEYHSLPRQNFPKTYLPNGYIDMFKPNYFMKNKNKLYGRILPFLTEETLDIDERKDIRK